MGASKADGFASPSNGVPLHRLLQCCMVRWNLVMIITLFLTQFCCFVFKISIHPSERTVLVDSFNRYATCCFNGNENQIEWNSNGTLWTNILE